MARLKALAEEYPLEIFNKSFLLRPDLPDEGRERPLRPGETPGQLSPHLKENALDAGLVNMKRPEWTPNPLKAHQTINYAKRHGAGAEVRDALYVAYWEEGRDIGQLPVLREIVEGAGLDWAPLEEELGRSAYLPAVMEEYQQAQDLGFDGIPAFVVGDMRFTGAQPMEVFRKVAGMAKEKLDADPDAFKRVKGMLT